MKKAYIKTYGCQMNVYDSQRMADALAPLGYVLSSAPENADPHRVHRRAAALDHHSAALDHHPRR